ncbi:MAG: hypothetical protein ABIS91_05790 [Nocardioides sp.]|uniref:hypothetical protein n=1 Tax=Nocardioides sp. TaxID=35761 RepID=UPI00326611DD
MRVETDGVEALFAGPSFSEIEQDPAKALPLALRGHRDVVQQQVVGPGNEHQ